MTVVMTVLRFLRLLLGVMAIGIAAWALTSQRGTQTQAGEAAVWLQQQIDEGIPTLQASYVDTGYEGRLVHLAGPLEIPSLSDSLTGFSVQALSIIRMVEMYQWQEEQYREYNDWEYRKIQVWSEDVIDEGGFFETELLEDHSNPDRLPHESGIHFWNEAVTLGNWAVAPDLFMFVSERKWFEPDMNNPPPLREGWIWLNANIIPRGQPSETGAFRLSYETLSVPAGTYSVLAKVVDGKLSNNIYGDLWGLPLAVRGHVSPEELSAQLSSHLADSYDPQVHWIPYSFFGLMLAIGVLARWIPHPWCRTYHGSNLTRRLLISAGVAAAGTLIIGIIA